MNAALLAIPVLNRLLVCRPPASKKISITMISTALRCFTNHLDIEGSKSILLKTFLSQTEVDEKGLDEFLDDIVFHNKDEWAAQWALPVGARLDILDFREIKNDEEVAGRFFAALKDALDDQSMEIQKDSRLTTAKVILGATEDTDQEMVRKAVSCLDDTAVIALKNAELESWVREIVADHAWGLLKGTKKNLLLSDRSLRDANKLKDEWKKRAEAAENQSKRCENELEQMETYMWKEGPKVFTKVLEDEGFLLPKRRTCDICNDTQHHKEPSIDREDLNRSGNVEEVCPWFSKDQRCEQCGQFPPYCYSNSKVKVCKAAQIDPCQRKHFAKMPPHTSAIHALDPEEDLSLIKKLVNTHGVMNFYEYSKYACVKIEIEDELMY